MKTPGHTITSMILLVVAAGLYPCTRCGGQISACLLATVDSSGNYTRPTAVVTELISVSDSGIILGCHEKAAQPGSTPTAWRERYTIRDGRLMLAAIQTSRVIPAQSERTVWDETPVMDSQLTTPAAGTEPAPGQPLHPALFTDGNLRMGSVGPGVVDSKWGPFQAYVQKIIEISQVQWQTILIENGLHPGPGSQVAVSFIIASKGQVSRISVAYHSAGVPDAIARACINAVTSRAPYGPWTPEMIAALGSEQELTFFFSYQ